MKQNVIGFNMEMLTVTIENQRLKEKQEIPGTAKNRNNVVIMTITTKINGKKALSIQKMN